MVVAQVIFPQRAATFEEAVERAKAAGERFRGLPGLRSKHFLFDPATRLGGGMYVWESRAAAEAYYTPEWSARMAELCGATPEVSIYEVPLVIDNTAVTVG